MGLLTRDKPADLPDIGAFTEDQWQAARRRHAWGVVRENVLTHYAEERDKQLAALGDQAEERARVERRYGRLEQPFLAEQPPEDWETPRESVVERPIGARLTTEEDLKLREMRAHTGRPWRHLRPGDGQARPAGYGPDEDVWIEEVDEDDG